MIRITKDGIYEYHLVFWRICICKNRKHPVMKGKTLVT